MKYIFAKFALGTTAQFFEKFGANNPDPQVFSKLWTACAEEFDPAERVPNTGTSAWRCHATADHHEMVVLTFPSPERRNEAYFVGVARLSESTCRVFCLERSITPPKFEDTTMLSELRPDGRCNWGPGTSPTVENFVARVRSILSDPQAAPGSFIPFQLL